MMAVRECILFTLILSSCLVRNPVSAGAFQRVPLPAEDVKQLIARGESMFALTRSGQVYRMREYTQVDQKWESVGSTSGAQHIAVAGRQAYLCVILENQSIFWLDSGGWQRARRMDDAVVEAHGARAGLFLRDEKGQIQLLEHGTVTPLRFPGVAKSLVVDPDKENDAHGSRVGPCNERKTEDRLCSPPQEPEYPVYKEVQDLKFHQELSELP